MNVSRNNGYFSINSEKLSNIADANFNKNYLTARYPARARSCSPALGTQNSSIAISAYTIDTSEKNITSEINLDPKKSNAMSSSPQLIAKHTGTNKNKRKISSQKTYSTEKKVKKNKTAP